MTRMDSSSAAEFEDQVKNVVESHVAVLQGVSCKLRLIAIPMTIRASEPLQEDDLLLKNVPAMRAVFRKLQLIRPNDGIVLLDTLFSGGALVRHRRAAELRCRCRHVIVCVLIDSFTALASRPGGLCFQVIHGALLIRSQGLRTCGGPHPGHFF